MEKRPWDKVPNSGPALGLDERRREKQKPVAGVARLQMYGLNSCESSGHPFARASIKSAQARRGRIVQGEAEVPFKSSRGKRGPGAGRRG